MGLYFNYFQRQCSRSVTKCHEITAKAIRNETPWRMFVYPNAVIYDHVTSRVRCGFQTSSLKLPPVGLMTDECIKQTKSLRNRCHPTFLT